LRYIINIWEYEEKNKLGLSLIIPIIFYHGKEEWEKRKLSEYFGGIDESFKKFIPEFDYILSDLSKVEDEKIKEELFKRDINKAFSLLLKYIFYIDKLKLHLEEIFEIIKPLIEDEKEGHYFITIITYLLNSSNISLSEIKEVVDKISEVGGEVMVTTAMRLRKEGKIEGKIEGKKEGLIEGEIKGKIEGRIEGKQNSIIRQMAKKFGITEYEVKSIQSCREEKRLDLALEEILFANSKEDVLKYFK